MRAGAERRRRITWVRRSEGSEPAAGQEVSGISLLVEEMGYNGAVWR